MKKMRIPVLALCCAAAVGMIGMETKQADAYDMYDETAEIPWETEYYETTDTFWETEYDETADTAWETEYYETAPSQTYEEGMDASETVSETFDHSFAEENYAPIRNSREKTLLEDYTILTGKDAENDFQLFEDNQLPETMYLDVPELFQKPELPTGCESVALTMALMFEGFELDKTTIAREFLIYNQETDNMAVGYIGDPFTEEGAGCFAPAIAGTAVCFFEDQGYDYQAYDISGTEFEELLSYVAIGRPVIVWGTMYMEEPVFTDTVTEYNGKVYRWYMQEHCMVLSGYDLKTQTVIINDPLEGIVTRDMTEFHEIYDKTGQNAVVLKSVS